MFLSIRKIMHFEKNLIIIVGVVGQLGFGDF